MADEEPVEELLERLRAGDEAAAAEVFNRFAQRLIALARTHLQRVIGNKEDPEDVVQSVYRSFFRRQREGQFQIDSWENVWGLLTVITLRKCGKRVEYFRAARRDVRREVRLSATESPNPWEPITQDPTPEESVVLADVLEQVMRGLEDTDREILSLHLQGYTVPEISTQVGFARRTVRRTLETIRNRLRRLEAG